MGNSMRATAAARQSSTDDLVGSQRSMSVDLAMLRAAIAEKGWTFDALAAAMQRDKAYIHRVVNGEKPMSHEFEAALPDDIEGLWRSKQAERFGYISVAPSSGDDAVRNLVSGLLGMLRPQLPARADAMAKASLPKVSR